MKDYDVVITSYGTLVAEWGEVRFCTADFADVAQKKKPRSSEYERVAKDGPLLRNSWHRIVCDEAHTSVWFSNSPLTAQLPQQVHAPRQRHQPPRR